MDQAVDGLTLEQRAELISKHPFFAGLTASEINQLAQLMQQKIFSKGEMIVKEGDLVDKIYLIASGEAEVSHQTTTLEATRNLPIATLRAGEAIGLSDEGFFSTNGRRTATVTALTDMTVLEIDVTQLKKFIQASSSHLKLENSAEKMLRVNFIKKAMPFAEMDLQDIYWLAERLEIVDVPADTVIFHQGDPGDKCYLIKIGKVAIIAENNLGSTVLATLETPAIFGETALLTASPRNATAKAVEAAQLLAISYRLLREVFRRNKKVAVAMKTMVMVRSRPKRNENIEAFEETTADHEQIVVLKQSDTQNYYRLSMDEWFLWQQIDGQKSVSELVKLYLKRSKGNEPIDVYRLLTNLASKGFITYVDSGGYMSIWNKLIKKFRGK